jgi:hypothetical protein
MASANVEVVRSLVAAWEPAPAERLAQERA